MPPARSVNHFFRRIRRMLAVKQQLYSVTGLYSGREHRQPGRMDAMDRRAAIKLRDVSHGTSVANATTTVASRSVELQ